MLIVQANNGVFGSMGPALGVGGPREGTAATDARPSEAQEPTEQDRRSIQRAAVRSGNVDLAKLSPEEQAQVRELQRRDQEVRTHEAAHMAAGGAYVRGGASYSYTSGPDGKRYAVGGEVGIDTSSVPDNPEATAAKMQTVRRAALAPAKPSAQDMSVAAKAAQAQAQARMEAATKAREEAEAPSDAEGPETAGVKEPSAEGHSEIPYNEQSAKAAGAQAGDLLDFYA